MDEQVYARAPDLLSDDFGDRVVVALEGETWIVLRSTAAFMWRLLEQPRSIEFLTEAAQRAFRGEPITIATDVRELLSSWTGRGIVRRF